MRATVLARLIGRDRTHATFASSEKDHAMTTASKRNSMIGRREMLRLGATGAVALAGAGAVRRVLAQSCSVNPSQTQGPYWVDEMLNRSDIRSDPASGILEPGLDLRLAINVSETTAGACAPVSGAWVDVWHCNALGVYSDVAAQGTLGQMFLRGYQETDAHGNVRFLTIYPGWYPGRTVHIHFRIRKFSGNQVTFNFVSQLYFDQAITNLIHQEQAPYSQHGLPNTTNATDGIYAQGGSQLLLRLAYNQTHAVASFNAVINSVPGSLALGVTPSDPEAEEHALDFGGGTPPLALA
jgi:protocatechuate 3,4-dioxygenase beta subunit